MIRPMLLLILSLSIGLTGCVREPDDDVIALRVANQGDHPITDLVVIFPDDHIDVGNVAIGETTPYLSAEHGVYRYAAYRFTVDGTETTQPVTDFTGERPVQGLRVTYKLDFDPDRRRPYIDLLDVVIDEPLSPERRFPMAD